MYVSSYEVRVPNNQSIGCGKGRDIACFRSAGDTSSLDDELGSCPDNCNAVSEASDECFPVGLLGCRRNHNRQVGQKTLAPSRVPTSAAHSTAKRPEVTQTALSHLCRDVHACTSMLAITLANEV